MQPLAPLESTREAKSTEKKEKLDVLDIYDQNFEADCLKTDKYIQSPDIINPLIQEQFENNYRSLPVHHNTVLVPDIKVNDFSHQYSYGNKHEQLRQSHRGLTKKLSMLMIEIEEV